MSEERHYVADTDELAADGSKAIAEVRGQEVAVFRLDGEYYAVANFCPHQSGPLCEGQTKGKVGIGDDGWQLEYSDETYIECPWHSWMFDIRTGEHAVDDRYAVPTYDVEVEAGEIYVTR
jgi:nitrite reductase/ring-hydroxylating ferredoxin subunit